MTRNQRKWWYGLIAGFLGGLWTSVDSGLAVMILAPREFNLDEKLGKTLLTMLVLGLLAGAKVAVAYLKQSPLPPMNGETEFLDKMQSNNTMKLILLITGLLFAAYVKTHAAEAAPEPTSFLSNVSVAPLGVVNIDPSNGDKEWGAGLKLDYKLNETVSLQLGLLAYDNWKGTAIDETPLEVKAVLFSSANKGASLYAIGGVDRSWRYDDWGMKAGLGVEFALSKRFSAFAETTYDVWNHGPDRIQVPFGIRFKL